jgi:hypothetical protein
MRVIKLLMLVVATSIVTFGSAQLLYTIPIPYFNALLLQGGMGVLAGGFVIMIICEDYDTQLIERLHQQRARLKRML